MSKHKKKHSKKSKAAVPDDIFEAAAQSVKRFRKVTNEIAKLSLGQKLVGSLVLVAAGLIYLDQRKSDTDHHPRPTPRFNWPRLTEAAETAAVQEAEVEPERAPPTLKSRKSPKPRKHHSPAARKPPSAADDG